MVLVMPAGLAFLYSGLARRKSALSLIWACMGSFSVITFQWYFWGYSLAFSASGTSGFIGDLQHFGLMNTLGEPSPGSPLIPELLYSFYQVCLALSTHEARWKRGRQALRSQKPGQDKRRPKACKEARNRAKQADTPPR
jgi:ammonia channel protein AmtB